MEKYTKMHGTLLPRAGSPQLPCPATLCLSVSLPPSSRPCTWAFVEGQVHSCPDSGKPMGSRSERVSSHQGPGFSFPVCKEGSDVYRGLKNRLPLKGQTREEIERVKIPKHSVFCPGWCGSVGWAGACKPRSPQFNSQSRHTSGWRARSPAERQPIHVTLPLFLPPFPSL